MSGPALILLKAEREIESIPSVFRVLLLSPDITRPKVPSGFGPMLGCWERERKGESSVAIWLKHVTCV